ncbi:DUF2059 domain-containing protein [Sphingomonas sp. dw_22]|uniref:DUF2059 domain-containing protein n=1 Tax=Sphingomonas sp. dw_22 TaxID=2721175 RepID=UPI001BD4B515|nr:DUF2059 domain-containing protein [Sphingomonas sp. dw_22]
MLRSILAAATLAVALPAAPALAQTASSTATAPDPARLAAAQALIGKIMPADQRDAMIERMVRPMMENMRSAMMSSPMFDAAKAENPKFAEVMDEFIKGEFEHSISMTKAAMPGMLDAMARAYARRFTLDDLKAISAFFETPAGRLYAAQAATIMSDPDVLAAQRTMMTEAMSGMQERVEALTARLSAAQESK